MPSSPPHTCEIPLIVASAVCPPARGDSAAGPVSAAHANRRRGQPSAGGAAPLQVWPSAVRGFAVSLRVSPSVPLGFRRGHRGVSPQAPPGTSDCPADGRTERSTDMTTKDDVREVAQATAWNPVKKLADLGVRSGHAYTAGFAAIGLSMLSWMTARGK